MTPYRPARASSLHREVDRRSGCSRVLAATAVANGAGVLAVRARVQADPSRVAGENNRNRETFRSRTPTGRRRSSRGSAAPPPRSSSSWSGSTSDSAVEGEAGPSRSKPQTQSQSQSQFNPFFFSRPDSTSNLKPQAYTDACTLRVCLSSAG